MGNKARKEPDTKIIVSRSTQLQHVWRVTQIQKSMELTHLPQISLYLLLVYIISYYWCFFWERIYPFQDMWEFLGFVHVFWQRSWNWQSTNRKSIDRGIISDCVPDTFKTFLFSFEYIVDIQTCGNFISVICFEISASSKLISASS